MTGRDMRGPVGIDETDQLRMLRQIAVLAELADRDVKPRPGADQDHGAGGQGGVLAHRSPVRSSISPVIRISIRRSACARASISTKNTPLRHPDGSPACGPRPPVHAKYLRTITQGGDSRRPRASLRVLSGAHHCTMSYAIITGVFTLLPARAKWERQILRNAMFPGDRGQDDAEAADIPVSRSATERNDQGRRSP